MVTDALRATLSRWGELEFSGRASGGYSNEVWFARMRDEELVVRVGKRSEAALAWELDVLALVAEAGLVSRSPCRHWTDNAPSTE